MPPRDGEVSTKRCAVMKLKPGACVYFYFEEYNEKGLVKIDTQLASRNVLFSSFL